MWKRAKSYVKCGHPHDCWWSCKSNEVARIKVCFAGYDPFCVDCGVDFTAVTLFQLLTLLTRLSGIRATVWQRESGVERKLKMLLLWSSALPIQRTDLKDLPQRTALKSISEQMIMRKQCCRCWNRGKQPETGFPPRPETNATALPAFHDSDGRVSPQDIEDDREILVSGQPSQHEKVSQRFKVWFISTR